MWGRHGLVGVALVVTCMLLAACGNQYVVNVNSFAAPNVATYRTYVIFPQNEGVTRDDLEFQEYSRQLARLLAERGYTEVSSPDQAQLAIFFGYGIGAPREHVASYDVPVYGQIGVASSTTNSRATSDGDSVSVDSKTTYTPRYGIKGYKTEVTSYTTYLRHITISAVDVAQYRGEKRVVEIWRTSITSNGSSSDLRSVVPIMLAAARGLVAANTGQAIERTMWDQAEDVVWVRGAIQESRTPAP